MGFKGVWLGSVVCLYIL